jgi:imidazolonepropionase-like amidohydrolase
VRQFLAAGVRVAIGTDSRASNPDLSVLAEARELVGSGAVSPAESLPMLSHDAAWALGYEHRAGSIAIGRPADLVVLAPSGPFTDPLDAILRPDTRVVATLCRGNVLHGQLPRD